MAQALTGRTDTACSLTTAWLELQDANGDPATGRWLDLSTKATSGDVLIYRGGDAHTDAEAGADSDTDVMVIAVSQLPISVPIAGYARILLAGDSSFTVYAAIRGGRA
jgi:hypothetical protein